VPPHIAKAAEKAADAFKLRMPYEEAVAAGKPADAGGCAHKPGRARLPAHSTLSTSCMLKDGVRGFLSAKRS